MAGRRLLDVAALFNAARGVAQKHVALRARQVDVYNRTSTLARAVRHQTDRITETAKAASFLASRLNENAPTSASEAGAVDSIPRKETTEGPSRTKPRAEIDQDHFSESSPRHFAIGRPLQDDLEVQQEKANRYPLPVGTIPSEGSTINTPDLDQEVLASRPQYRRPQEQWLNHEIPRQVSEEASISLPRRPPTSPEAARTMHPQSELQIPSKTADAYDDYVPVDSLAASRDEDSFYRKSLQSPLTLSSLPRIKVPQHTSAIQRGDFHPSEQQINSDSFYNPTITRPKNESILSLKAVPDQEQIPDGVRTDLFYSPRVARSLSGRVQRATEENLTLKSAKVTTPDRTRLSSGKDSFYDRRSLHEEKTSLGKANTTYETPIQRLESSKEDRKDLAQDTLEARCRTEQTAEAPAEPSSVPYELRESKVPSSRLGRLWNYGSLAAGMFGGAIGESLRRASGGGGHGSYMLSASNMDRLVAKLSRMRGAALKLGQVISFQDSKMLPAPIQEVLQRVQDRADYMPPSQRNKVLAANLGPAWRDIFSSFDEKPLAAASIGQVHSAILKSNGARVAVKVQYPGVADSIDSDLNNLAILLTASRLLPKGLFLDKTIANARTELAWECDYLREADCGRRFEHLLADEKDVFSVPRVYSEASGKQVLTMEYMDGVGVTRVQSFSQEQKDWIGTQILRLCLREITEFKFMQTDPNWTNFLYNAETKKLELLDFGASREYPEVFITKYKELLAAASRSDKETVRLLSLDLGYLTGHESKAMLNAHVASVLTLAEPFLDSSPEIYDFKDQTITDRVKELIPLMIRERLAPPPEETYSLHRKLSGAFLLCARLGSRVRCRELFKNSMEKGGVL